MITHTLACGLCSNNPDSGKAWIAIMVLFAVIGVAGIAAGSREQERKAKGLPPREPASDISPALASFISGRTVQAYASPVRARTPGGIEVRFTRCCQRGHQSPALAVRHAEQVAWRIADDGAVGSGSWARRALLTHPPHPRRRGT